MTDLPVSYDETQRDWVVFSPRYLGPVEVKAVAARAYRNLLTKLRGAPASATQEAKRAFADKIAPLAEGKLRLCITGDSFDLFKSTERVGKRIISLGAAHG